METPVNSLGFKCEFLGRVLEAIESCKVAGEEAKLGGPTFTIRHNWLSVSTIDVGCTAHQLWLF